jgi:hypothetical protein
VPHQANLAMNVIRSIILIRYHKVAQLVTEYHFHKFNEEHGVEIESMLNTLGAKRDKSVIEQWIFSTKDTIILKP